MAAGVVLLVILVTYLTGSFTHTGDLAEVTRHIVYTAFMRTDSPISLPPAIRSDLRSVGLAHEKIALTRIEGDGQASTSVVDLTPRTGDSPTDPPLAVPDRALPKIDARIDEIERAINSPGTVAGRALFIGLTHTDFTGVPTIIVSSGLDLADPIDFRALGWSVTPDDIVTNVRDTGVQPALHGPVTFVPVPPAGEQPQLGQAEKRYLDGVWRTVLGSAGATSVTFVAPEAGTPDAAARLSAAPAAPTVPPLPLPGTPIKPVAVPEDPDMLECVIPGSYFVVNTPALINPEQTRADLANCVMQAVTAGATFGLDGWTSYDGPLTPDGRPAVDDPGNRRLSEERVATIAGVLSALGVAEQAISHRTGHGNTDQPYPPDPRSELNRTVHVSYTLPTTAGTG